jgi:hypothetical protein
VFAAPTQRGTTEGPDACPFRRREPAAVHSADHDKEERQHRPDIAQREEATPPMTSVLRAGPVRTPRGDDRRCSKVQAKGQQPGNEAAANNAPMLVLVMMP